MSRCSFDEISLRYLIQFLPSIVWLHRSRDDHLKFHNAEQRFSSGPVVGRAVEYLRQCAGRAGPWRQAQRLDIDTDKTHQHHDLKQLPSLDVQAECDTARLRRSWFACRGVELNVVR